MLTVAFCSLDIETVGQYLEDKAPAYILFRLDEKTTQGFNWVFMCYVPDYAKVRDKMLYASSRATLRKALGDYRFVDEIFGTERKEFGLEGFSKFRVAKNAAAPLTEREEEIARMRKEESGSDVGITTKKSHVHGVSLPVSDKAQQALESLRDGSVNYVQLSVNVANEDIDLEISKDVDVNDIAGLTPADHPRYHFFRYRHAFEDNTLEQIIFLYSCPMSSKVKERMLYSSCKSAISALGVNIGLTIDKNAEVSETSEITEAYIFEELHPKKPEEKKAFKKPARPTSRPPSRTPTPAAQ